MDPMHAQMPVDNAIVRQIRVRLGLRMPVRYKFCPHNMINVVCNPALAQRNRKTVLRQEKQMRRGTEGLGDNNSLMSSRHARRLDQFTATKAIVEMSSSMDEEEQALAAELVFKS